MRAATALLACVSAWSVAACDRSQQAPPPGVDLRTVLGGQSPEGFARATPPAQLQFPRDHGPHRAFRTEWWYWTGNVTAAGGREFGFELVFFRIALAAPGAAPERAAALASDQLVLAHAALTDVDGDRFLFAARTLRCDDLRAGLRGGDGPLWLFCGDWSARATDGGDGFSPLVLRAAGEQFAFELELVQRKPLVLQGDRGLSQKSSAPGNASFYYSVPRWSARGTVQAFGQRHAVHGSAWCDREWSTSALGPDQIGWDWFSLQLDDGSELMWYQLRDRDGAVDPHSQGVYVRQDGGSERLLVGDASAVPRGAVRAADGRASYPAAWHVAVPRLQLELDVVPRVADQELRTLVRYWEGSVAVRGTRGGAPVAGLGYLEMTGYSR